MQKYWLAIGLILIMIITCRPPDTTPKVIYVTPTAGPLAATPTPEPGRVLVKGFVYDQTTTLPVPGAEVTLGSAQSACNYDGYFELAVNPEEVDSILGYNPGYTRYRKPLELPGEGELWLELNMLAVDFSLTIDPAKPGGNTVISFDGAAVTLPELTGIPEDVVVSLTSYDVSSGELESVPGDFSAVDAASRDVTLVSQGMIDVEITGAESGDSYSLDGMGTYEITIPITGDPATAPDTIPLWYYDEETNKWIEEGVAARDGDFYRGTVTHFSTWNADIAFYNNTCITGTIADPDHLPGDSYRITITGAGISKQKYQTDLSFTIINLPLDTPFTVTVTKVVTGETWTDEITTPAVSGGGCMDIGDFPNFDNIREVRNFMVRTEENRITLTWDDPPEPDLSHIEIDYSIDGVDWGTAVFAPGMEEWIYSFPEEGLYQFTARTVLTDDSSSNGLTRRIRYAANYWLTIDLQDFEEDTEVYLYMNGNQVGMLYTEPLLLPAGLGIELVLEPGGVNAEWIVNDGYVDDWTNSIEITLWEDLLVEVYPSREMPS